AGHGARQNAPRRRDRADAQRPFQPRADEAHFIVEADTLLELELPDLMLDLFADAVALLFEQPDLPFDLALDEIFTEFEEAKLPPDLLLELCQGRQRHGPSRENPNATKS